MLTNLNLTDMETCYKAVRGDLARSLPLMSDRFGFEPEITARLARAGRPHLRGADQLLRTHVRRGQKDRLARRLGSIRHILRFNLFR